MKTTRNHRTDRDAFSLEASSPTPKQQWSPLPPASQRLNLAAAHGSSDKGEAPKQSTAPRR